MAAQLRFYLDENLPVEIASQLRLRSIEALTARDVSLLSPGDEHHLAYAREMGFVICTNDADFLELAARGVEHHGIVFGQQDIHYIGDWVNWLTLMHAIYTAADMENRIDFL